MGIAPVRARDFALLAIGFGCLVGYSRMVALGFVGYLTQGVVESSDPWYAVRVAAILATLAVLAANGLKGWFRLGTKSLIACVAVAVAAPIVMAVDQAGRWGALVAVMSGASSAVYAYAWLMLLSRQAKGTIVGATFAGLPVAGVIILGATRLDPTMALVVAVASAFAAGSCALLLDSDLASCRPDGRPGREQVARIPWITVGIILACGFSATFLYGVSWHLTWLYDWAPNNVAYGVAAVAVLAATAAIMLRSDRWQQVAWVPQLVVLSLALALSCLSVRESIQAAVGFMLAAVFCSHFLHWTVFAALFSQQDAPRACLAGVVTLLGNGTLAAMAGDAVGAVLPHSMQNLGGVAGIMVMALVIFVVALMAVCRRLFGLQAVAGSLAGATPPAKGEDGTEAPGLPGNSVASHPETDATLAGVEADAVQAGVTGGGTSAPSQPSDPLSDFEREQPAPNPADALKARMDAYAQEFGLTPREAEVALLTMQGFSAAYIAEKLVVSNSTVRFHQQNIYRKFDVHSRNELIELAALD